MKRLRILLVSLAAVVIGCASGGGPVGTGLSASSVSGNVIDVQSGTTGAAAVAADTVPTIHVSIDEAPGLATSTDADGNFALSGDFSGAITLRFSAPQFQVTQALDVPAGSSIVLQDVELRPDGVQAQAARELDFVGRVDMVDCTDGTLLLDDPRHSGMQFMVQLTADTTIGGPHGEAASCEQIHPGDTIGVDGLLQLGSPAVTALNVVLGPPPPPREPPPSSDVPLRGSIAAIDCTGGFLVVSDPMHSSRLRLSASTDISGPQHTPLTCADLQVGDRIMGEGQLNIGMPGVIDALQIVVNGGPPPDGDIHFFGFVLNVDCVLGGLQLGDVTTTVDVRILPTTLIMREQQPPATCADIHIGDRIEGEGQPSSEAPGAIDASRLSVRPRDHGPDRGMTGGPGGGPR